MAELVRKRSVHIRDARIAGLYDLEHTIGQGHFAVVKLARHVFTGERVAVKIIDKSNLDSDSMGHVMQEVRCMKLVQHANIVRLYEVIDTNTKLFLILELGDYDMHDFIIKHENGVEESLAQQYFCQIITAIDYCHRLHVVHRDLKPENVVFFEKLGMVKLTDFGFSNHFEPGEQLRTACGSLAYSAPEILLGDAYDAPAVDVWSLGVILFMLVCGRLPFQEANDSETLTKILDCRYNTPDHLSNACRNLIQRMLVRDPSKRAGLAEIVSNAWVMAGDRGHAAVLPLIVKHHLPHAAHTTIIEQMVVGGVGTEEAILRALENDEYNSMTATYYLLAERVLASCRQEQAKELMAKTGAGIPEEELQDNESRLPGATPSIGSRCCSRSNSWRARPCTILKEESEEELSSYLRSSRHSSRSFSNDSNSMSVHSAAHETSPLRPSFVGGEVRDVPRSLPIAKVAQFDELSPIAEHCLNAVPLTTDNEEKNSELVVAQRRAVFARTRSCGANNTSRSRFSKSDDEDTSIGASSRQRSYTGLVEFARRNSSPSISMFSGTRDRVSPQAVQDLMELCRLGGGRRAVSPESLRSSRSPSPPTSSGRASPAMSSLSSLSRLKVASASFGGGMRKLSSSPHLLGICEEGEDVDSNTVLHTTARQGSTRSNRSSSTGLSHLRHGTIQPVKSTGAHAQPTYSSVRMIRPRHAVVSPDVCRRYDQHQRLIARSRRSTSCSSSEASDDEEGKRLSILGSMYCGRKRDDNDRDDTAGGQGGVAGGSAGGNEAGKCHFTCGGSGTSASGDSSRERRSGGATEGCSSTGLQHLCPIPEMTHLDSNRGECLRAKLLHRSHTAERIARDWASVYTRNYVREISCFGTPPRDVVNISGENRSSVDCWIRTLKRTYSDDGMQLAHYVDGDSIGDSVFDIPAESVLSSVNDILERSSDSGCSSERVLKESMKENKLKNCEISPLSSLHPLLLYDQPRREKVDIWLRSTHFI
ncbi:Serine/threonine protein kinase [Trichostrongylus colubriformis]|uniref:SNF-related serine/threonine-protein kinase n=1 Tax=Trichostrongylus colubriformis TaxID=6319 RepID=A0AAN8IPH5_TRICO